ncbi:MAG TPA: hypothetical protein VLE22_01370 [Bryobacteraceae bacterium]|nr:hypothetical protein [Bryobacteraceae bacterium]
MKNTLWKALIEQRLTLGGWLHPACVEVVARRASTGCAWTRRMDLSGSFGKTGDFDCTEMGDTLDTYKQACRRHRKSTGLYIIRPTQENRKT